MGAPTRSSACKRVSFCCVLATNHGHLVSENTETPCRARHATKVVHGRHETRLLQTVTASQHCDHCPNAAARAQNSHLNDDKLNNTTNMCKAIPDKGGLDANR